MTKPPEPGHVLHKRAYDIESVYVGGTIFRLIGRIQDVRPDGLWGVDDDQPLKIHDMVVTFDVDVTTLTIIAVDVQFDTFPEPFCPGIAETYQSLVGLSIARGYTHKVREAFGGPRGCTHVGALLNAMAPVAVQSIWALGHLQPPPTPEPGQTADEARVARRRRNMERNRDTCHVWATDGPMFDLLDNPEPGELHRSPLWAMKRCEELGIDPEEWLRSIR